MAMSLRVDEHLMAQEYDVVIVSQPVLEAVVMEVAPWDIRLATCILGGLAQACLSVCQDKDAIPYLELVFDMCWFVAMTSQTSTRLLMC
jgi:hypothetical protein